MNRESAVAETVRAACIEAALAAYEEGGVLGLCAEGRWEYAVSAMRELNLEALWTKTAFTARNEEPAAPRA